MKKDKVCIGIDVGGTNLRYTLVDMQGDVLYRDRQPTAINMGKGDFLNRLLASIKLLKKEGASLGKDVVAVGAGVPGLISNDGEIHSSVNLQPLEGINLQQFISSESGLPAFVINDANAGAWGEKCFGAGRSMESFIMLTLGTGVGSGLVLNGKVWTGIDGVAGEFGHSTVEPEGKLCRCGNRGCLEQYASASAIVANTIDALQGSSIKTVLGDIPPAEITSEVIAEAAGNGDQFAGLMFEQAGRYLGIASATLANLLNLEGIIIAGGVAASFDLLAAPTHREIIARAFPIPARRLKLLRSELGDDAGILGAAANAMALLQ